MPSAPLKKIDICGVRITNLSSDECILAIDNLVKGNDFAAIFTANVDHIVKFKKDPEFKEAYNSASIILADSMPLIWTSQFLNVPLKEKISGSDLFPRLCEVSARKGWKVFFLGGREKAAKISAEVLIKKYPALQVVGTYCPPFEFENNFSENEKVIKMISDAEPDILFVGLGAPKQEKWIYRYKNKYQVPVSIGIGASFDFIAGIIKRAPVWMQKVGLEWFWRLLMEPGRLWKRYLIDDMQFFWLILSQRFKKGLF